MTQGDHVPRTGGLPEPRWIGVDGGATSVKAGQARLGELGWESVGLVRERAHRPVPGFRPVARVAALAGQPGELEQRAAEQRLEECAALLARVAQDAGAQVALAIAMPGEKTRDGRGIQWARNGPRATRFLVELEARLLQLRVPLAGPLSGLYSDAECAAHGEQVARDGGLAGVQHAWYLGGGTGLAEACILGGRITPLAELDARLQRAWERSWSGRVSFEDVLSARGLNARAGGNPEELILDSDRAHQALLECVGALAAWADERARLVESRTGQALERVLVGQRLGQILGDPRCQVAMEALGTELERLGRPRSGWLQLSKLRSAGTLGAAACARAAWEASRA